ncbi:MAG: hypothetical protein ACPLKZ_07370, partial [Candidatus Bathyarchaeales archaeon]
MLQPEPQRAEEVIAPSQQNQFGKLRAKLQGYCKIGRKLPLSVPLHNLCYCIIRVTCIFEGSLQVICG